MLRRSGLIKDCLIVCSPRRTAQAASVLAVDADVSELPDVSSVELGVRNLERPSDSQVGKADVVYRQWFRLWSINFLL